MLIEKSIPLLEEILGNWEKEIGKDYLVDVSLGMLRSGLSREQVKSVRRNFPNSGFHKTLFRLTFSEFKRNPLKPLPVMKI